MGKGGGVKDVPFSGSGFFVEAGGEGVGFEELM